MRLKLWQIITIVSICVGTLVVTVQSARDNDDELCNTDFLRFHVVANSDSEEDQKLKLIVRDGLLEEINSELVKEVMAKPELLEEGVAAENKKESVSSGVDNINKVRKQSIKIDIEDSRAYVKNNISRLEEVAEEIVMEKGYDYEVKAELGVRWIPEKTYENVTFPAGNYEALTMVIGEGAGKNWWCVLFPPLCLIGLEPPKSQDDFVDIAVSGSAISGSAISGSAISGSAIEMDKLDDKYAPLTQNKGQATTLKIKFKTAELLRKM